jgi:hypothetical protein
MRALAAIAIVGIAVSASAADLESWRKDFAQKRGALPDFKAVVTEEFIVKNPKPPEKDGLGITLSWGADNGKRKTTIAYTKGKVAVSTPQRFGKDVPGLRQDFKYVQDGEKAYATVSGGTQGTVDKAADFRIWWSPDAMFGFLDRQGSPWETLVPSDATITEGDVTKIRWEKGDETHEIVLDKALGGQVTSWALMRGGSDVMRGTVNTSTTTALGPMPATVTTVWYDGGTETKRLVSTIEYSTEKPTAKDFDRDWKEGALIRDNITRQLGKWHNGQFVVDQASTDLFNRPFSPWTPLFLGGVAAVFFVGTGFAVRRVARRRRSPGAVKS